MDTLNNISDEELQRLLHNGMGRAILFLMNQDHSQYRDLILDCCLHNYAYDCQVEGSCADYLYPLIKKLRDEEYFRSEILRAIPDETNNCDAEQLLDFTVLFAKYGCEEARKAIYEKLRSNNTDEVLTGQSQAIELDGAKGLIFLLDMIGGDPKLINWNQKIYSIEETEAIDGVDKVRLALSEAAAQNPNVAAALANMEYYSPEWSAEEIIKARKQMRKSFFPKLPELSEDTTWKEVKGSQYFKRLVHGWSRLAKDEEIEKAARDLDQNEEPEVLSAHLRIFYKCPFPLEPDVLIHLIDHPDSKVGLAALIALELVSHEKVRKLFYRLLDDPEWSDRAIGLLRSNYKTGDYELIENQIRFETDSDRLHLICGNTSHVYKDNPLPEGMKPLLAAYDRGPCSVCRCTCLETIQKIGELPDWLIEECQYDAYSETRKMAAELKKKLSI